MYSCLSLRLPRARKTWWKSLTSKIQSKLHNPKAITIAKTKTKTKRSSSSSSPSRPHKYYFFLKAGRRRRRSSSSSILSNVAARPPVFVDRLFKELPPPQATTSIHVVAAERVVAEKRPPSVIDKAAKLVAVDGRHDHDRTQPDGGGCAAGDDAWEAMGFASPLMRGIDERAEQFIARFRADMEVQEMLARGL